MCTSLPSRFVAAGGAEPVHINCRVGTRSVKRPVRNVEMIHLSVMKIKFGEGNLEDFKQDWVFDRNRPLVAACTVHLT